MGDSSITGDDGLLEAARQGIDAAADLASPRTKCSYCRQPYALVSDDPTTPPTPRPLMKCAGCISAYYCSKEHQRMDWKRHKVLCKSIQVKLAAVAAAEAEAQLSHGAPVVPTPESKSGFGLFPRRRYGSNTQLCSDQRDQRMYAAAVGNVSLESSCRSSTNCSPPNDQGVDGGSSSSSVHGSMADLISATSKGGRYSIGQTVGNPKRARFPLTVIRERRSSIGSGEAARLAAAAAAAAGNSAPTPPQPRGESDSDDEAMESPAYTSDTLAGGMNRKRPAASSMRNQKTRSNFASRAHLPADRSASDATDDDAALPRLHHRLMMNAARKDPRSNPILNLNTDPRFQLDAMVPRHTSFVLRVRRLALCVASALREHGWCVVDNFLGETHAKAIYHETTSLYMTPGLFADGQLMKGSPAGQAPPQLQSSKDVRSDQIYWFDNRVDRGVNIGFLVSMVDSIVFHLTDDIPPYRVNGRSRAMIACYPGHGTKYVRHVDNPDRDGRCVTTIYYLNENWKREHGGTLRMYPESSPGPVDIEPLFDRLLFFWSDRRNPHEVLPAYRNRFAITIWYFDADERAEALAREQHEHHQHHQRQSQTAAALLVDRNLTAVRLTEAEQRHGTGAPRSASCASLSNASGQDSQANRDSPSSICSLSHMQQHMSLDSPRSHPCPVDTAASQPHQSAQQSTVSKRDFGTATDPTLTADYSQLLPADVINKLLALSARRDSRDQVPETTGAFIHGVGRGGTRSNLTSPASSEVDPVSDN